jgi:hypothetical protein
MLKAVFAAIFCATVFIPPALSEDSQQRFVEFPTENDVTIFDLASVKIVQPGRFTILHTTLYNADVMRFRMGIIDVLRQYWSRPDGKYLPPPQNVLSLGPPELSLASIDKEHGVVAWPLPYVRFKLYRNEQDSQFYDCNHDERKTDEQNYSDQRRLLTNGSTSQYLFDCRCAFLGLVHDDDVSGATLIPMTKGRVITHYYERSCLTVTHEMTLEPQ